MKVFLKVILAVIVLGVIGGGFYYFYVNRDKMPSESVCRKNDELYSKKCEDVGKVATARVMGRTISYGEILGVAWRPRGSEVLGLGNKKFTSDRNEYYYIVSKDGGETISMQRVSSIIPKKKQK